MGVFHAHKNKCAWYEWLYVFWCIYVRIVCAVCYLHTNAKSLHVSAERRSLFFAFLHIDFDRKLFIIKQKLENIVNKRNLCNTLASSIAPHEKPLKMVEMLQCVVYLRFSSNSYFDCCCCVCVFFHQILPARGGIETQPEFEQRLRNGKRKECLGVCFITYAHGTLMLAHPLYLACATIERTRDACKSPKIRAYETFHFPDISAPMSRIHHLKSNLFGIKFLFQILFMIKGSRAEPNLILMNEQFRIIQYDKCNVQIRWPPSLDDLSHGCEGKISKNQLRIKLNRWTL